MSKAAIRSPAEIPPKPKVVSRHEAQQREELVFGICRFIARGQNLPTGGVWGASFANGVIEQMMRNAIGQSQIVVPTPQVIHP